MYTDKVYLHRQVLLQAEKAVAARIGRLGCSTMNALCSGQSISDTALRFSCATAGARQ